MADTLHETANNALGWLKMKMPGNANLSLNRPTAGKNRLPKQL